MAGGVHGRGCAWQGAFIAGGMHGRGHAWQGACMAEEMCMVGGMHGRGHAWQGCVCATHPPPRQILLLRRTVNEWAVRILLECILVKILVTV